MLSVKSVVFIIGVVTSVRFAKRWNSMIPFVVGKDVCARIFIADDGTVCPEYCAHVGLAPEAGALPPKSLNQIVVAKRLAVVPTGIEPGTRVEHDFVDVTARCKSGGKGGGCDQFVPMPPEVLAVRIRAKRNMGIIRDEDF